MIIDQLLDRVFGLAKESRDRGDHPFGALLVINSQVVAEAHNRVSTDRDITAHAEVMLVRDLEAINQLDLLGLGTVYASCEPCPMCVGALFWAGARNVVFGLSHERLNEITTAPGVDTLGFKLSAQDIGAFGQPSMVFDGPHNEDDAAKVHAGFWH